MLFIHVFILFSPNSDSPRTDCALWPQYVARVWSRLWIHSTSWLWYEEMWLAKIIDMILLLKNMEILLSIKLPWSWHWSGITNLWHDKLKQKNVCKQEYLQTKSKLVKTDPDKVVIHYQVIGRMIAEPWPSKLRGENKGLCENMKAVSKRHVLLFLGLQRKYTLLN